jgi:hypothetical protein
MSAFPAPVPPAPALWSEARAPDGRVYYYNTQTKVTQWTKPAELMSPAEVRLSDSPFTADTRPESSDSISLERIHVSRRPQVLA